LWLSLNGAPIRDASGAVTRIVLAFEDVTERKRTRHRLVGLNQLSRDLADAETADAVADLAVEAARETVPAPIVAIAFYDEEAGHPRPAARTESAAELAENGTLFPADADLPWQVFVHQTEIVSADLTDVDGDASETPLWSGAIFPLGDHGVLVVGSRRPDAFSGTDVSLASMLVATTRSALDRVARERTLRKHTNSLEEKNAVLERLQRTNDTIRGSTTQLIRASTRAAVIQAVCAELTSADAYSFAWIGTRDAVTEEVGPDAAWPRTDAERRGHGGLELTVPTEVVRTDSPDRCHSD